MKTTSSSPPLVLLCVAVIAVSCGPQEQAPRSGVIITLDTTRLPGTTLNTTPVSVRPSVWLKPGGALRPFPCYAK